VYYSAAVLEDGYAWRKYGQKFAKASPYPTCYYKCAHAGCPVKRQVSRGPNQELQNVYKGAHNHARPTVAEAEVFTGAELREVVASRCVFTAEAPDPNAKLVVRVNPPEDGNDDPADPLSDGLRWRKYGQKIVRSSTIVKAYYRCYVKECPARKLVQSANRTDGEEMVPEPVVIHYEGCHSHPASEALEPRKGKRPSRCRAPEDVPIVPVPLPHPGVAVAGNPLGPPPPAALSHLGIGFGDLPGFSLPEQHPSVSAVAAGPAWLRQFPPPMPPSGS
jgi:hypothetical protein